MSLTVAPSASRGSASSLQPLYYASSLFVDPMRDDIRSLLVAFVTAYTREPFEPERPFELFKTIWKDQGWDLVHLKVLEARTRVFFLQTVMRLILERMDPAEYSLIRVGALFALYTFYNIQPESSEVRLESVEYITLSIDSYEQLLAFPSVLHPPLRHYVTYIVSKLLSLEVFHIIPHTSLGAHNPRILPHTMPLLIQDIDHGPKKKTGRPSRLAQRQRADKALSELETFNSSSLSDPPNPNDYLVLKDQLRSAVSSEALKAAEALTMERIEAAERHVRDKSLPLDDRQGLERLRKLSKSSGLLSLLEKDKD